MEKNKNSQCRRVSFAYEYRDVLISVSAAGDDLGLSHRTLTEGVKLENGASLQRVTHRSKNIRPRLGAGRSVREPERERRLLSPPASPYSVYSAARWRRAAPSDLRHNDDINSNKQQTASGANLPSKALISSKLAANDKL